jgi:hypothetical protein
LRHKVTIARLTPPLSGKWLGSNGLRVKAKSSMKFRESDWLVS